MEAGLRDEKIEIEKLGADDWWEWKYNMSFQLKARKLWSHVEGTATLAGDASIEQRTQVKLKEGSSAKEHLRDMKEL